MKTIQDAAQSALDVQNACNLTGVLHSYSAAMKIVREEAKKQGEGTDWINQHPISRLYADKVVSLSGMRFHTASDFSKDYAAVEKLASKKESGMSAGDLVNALIAGGSTNIA